MLTSLLLLVDFGSKDKVNIVTISSLAVGFAIFAVSFVLVERYWAPQPMIPPSLMKQGRDWAYLVMQIFVMCAQFTASHQ